MDHLALYSRNCKKCKHLDPEEKIAYDKCHYTNGNTECPAKEVQISVVGMARRFAKAMKKAQATSDVTRQIQILKAVEGRSDAFKLKYRDWLTK